MFSWLWLTRSEGVVIPEAVALRSTLPKGSFVQTVEAYEAIGGGLLTLETSPPTLELPDLRTILLYYGANGRPDAEAGGKLLHFGLKSDQNPHSVPIGQKLYLSYNRNANPPQYIFSPDNRETGLWVEGVAEGKEVALRVRMKNENGQLIEVPECCAAFRLKEKEFLRFKSGTWELGGFRVDGTLLARQQARWYGPDLFLQRHGGDEYKEQQGKQRVDFGTGDDLYSVFIGDSDCLIWKDGKWVSVKAGAVSRGHPLLCINKVAERIITFDLWDAEGKRKVTMNLIKAVDVWAPKELHQDFHFVGSRTRKQTILDIRGERMVMRPQDWLLLTDDGWKKLTTLEEIDDYVSGKTPGPLFVFDGIEKRDDQQVLTGVMFNSSRSQFEPIEMPLQAGTTFTATAEKEKDKEKEKEVAVKPTVPVSPRVLEGPEMRRPLSPQEAMEHENMMLETDLDNEVGPRPMEKELKE